MTKLSQPHRRRCRHSLVFWYLLPLPSPVSVNAADAIDAINADTADTVVTDAADAATPAALASDAKAANAKAVRRTTLSLIKPTANHDSPRI